MFAASIHPIEYCSCPVPVEHKWKKGSCNVCFKPLAAVAQQRQDAKGDYILGSTQQTMFRAQEDWNSNSHNSGNNSSNNYYNAGMPAPAWVSPLYQTPAGATEAAGKSEFACANYRIDTSAAFGVCACGHPKADHGKPRQASSAPSRNFASPPAAGGESVLGPPPPGRFNKSITPVPQTAPPSYATSMSQQQLALSSSPASTSQPRTWKENKERNDSVAVLVSLGVSRDVATRTFDENPGKGPDALAAIALSRSGQGSAQVGATTRPAVETDYELARRLQQEEDERTQAAIASASVYSTTQPGQYQYQPYPFSSSPPSSAASSSRCCCLCPPKSSAKSSPSSSSRCWCCCCCPPKSSTASSSSPPSSSSGRRWWCCSS